MYRVPWECRFYLDFPGFYLAQQQPCCQLVWRTPKIRLCVISPQESSLGRKAAQAIILIIPQSFSSVPQPHVGQDIFSLPTSKRHFSLGMLLPSWPGGLCGDQKGQSETLKQRGEGMEHQPVSSQDSLPLRVLPRLLAFYFRGKKNSQFCFLVKRPLAPAALPFVREKAQTVFSHIVAMSLKLGTEVWELGPVLELDHQARTWGTAPLSRILL